MADIIHRDLTNAELHEVKGAAGSTINHVLTSDGSGSAAFVDPNSIIDAIEEAPIDGRLYVRRNAAWVVSPTDPSVLHYQVNTNSTSPAPQSQHIEYNDSDQSLATEIYFDDEDQISRIVLAVLLAATVGTGNLVIVDAVDLGHTQTWDIDVIVDNGGYVTYEVSNPVIVGADFTDDQPINVRVA